MKKIFVIFSLSLFGCTSTRQAEKPIILEKASNGFLMAHATPLSGSRETVLYGAYHAIPQPVICPKNVLIHPISVQLGYSFKWTRGIGIFELKSYKYWYIIAFLPYDNQDSLQVLKIVERKCCNPSTYEIVYRDSVQKTDQYAMNERGKYVKMKAI